MSGNGHPPSDSNGADDDGDFEQLASGPDKKGLPRGDVDSPDPDAANDKPGRAKKRGAGLSLKARAVGFLSRREHSRLELERKLAPYAADAAELERVLDQLEREQWLSNQRFAQALVNRRAQRQGVARIVQELRQHGLADEQITDLRAQLQTTEIQRARQVWEKKFNEAPRDAREYAKQFRFLASRGFSADCLRRIIGEIDDTSPPE